MFGFFLASCGKSENTKKEEKNMYTERFIETMTKPNQEAVALLSQKYDLQPYVIENFLDKYLLDTDIVYSSLKSSTTDATKSDHMEMMVLEKDKYLQALEKAAQTVGISTKTAALIVLDYKMLIARGNDREWNEF